MWRISPQPLNFIIELNLLTRMSERLKMQKTQQPDRPNWLNPVSGLAGRVAPVQAEVGGCFSGGSRYAWLREYYSLWDLWNDTPKWNNEGE